MRSRSAGGGTGRLVDAALESLRGQTRQRNDIPERWRLNGDGRDVLISRTWLWPRTPALRVAIRNEIAGYDEQYEYGVDIHLRDHEAFLADWLKPPPVDPPPLIAAA